MNSFFNYLPALYDTRYSYVLSLYGTLVDITKLTASIHTESGIMRVPVAESPHYSCAAECLNQIGILQLLSSAKKLELNGLIDANNLRQTKKYLEYIRDFHPETDPIETLIGFLALAKRLSTERTSYDREVCVLVSKRKDRGGNCLWVLVDGLHRSSILLALNEREVNARVAFP